MTACEVDLRRVRAREGQQLADQAGLRDEVRIGGEDPGHVREDLAGAGADGSLCGGSTDGAGHIYPLGAVFCRADWYCGTGRRLHVGAGSSVDARGRDDASFRRSATIGICRFIDVTALARHGGSKGKDDSRSRLAWGSVRFTVGFTGRACRDPSRLFR